MSSRLRRSGPSWRPRLTSPPAVGCGHGDRARRRGGRPEAASDHARPQDLLWEGVKLLGTGLQGDRVVTFCRLLARNTVGAKPAQLASGTPTSHLSYSMVALLPLLSSHANQQFGIQL
ncbi:hypothetical protein ZWY2020_038687 [Hordeum vulgare]|nr:hypothetical protein ZWY2020_038687 [Hordeum vulgare]